jgi:hypothetical protein
VTIRPCLSRNQSRSSDVRVGEDKTALIFFVTRLLHRLQQMASVPAIDYALYGEAIPGTSENEGA